MVFALSHTLTHINITIAAKFTGKSNEMFNEPKINGRLRGSQVVFIAAADTFMA